MYHRKSMHPRLTSLNFGSNIYLHSRLRPLKLSQVPIRGPFPIFLPFLYNFFVGSAFGLSFNLNRENASCRGKLSWLLFEKFVCMFFCWIEIIELRLKYADDSRTLPSRQAWSKVSSEFFTVKLRRKRSLLVLPIIMMTLTVFTFRKFAFTRHSTTGVQDNRSRQAALQLAVLPLVAQFSMFKVFNALPHPLIEFLRPLDGDIVTRKSTSRFTGAEKKEFDRPVDALTL